MNIACDTVVYQRLRYYCIVYDEEKYSVRLRTVGKDARWMREECSYTDYNFAFIALMDVLRSRQGAYEELDCAEILAFPLPEQGKLSHFVLQDKSKTSKILAVLAKEDGKYAIVYLNDYGEITGSLTESTLSASETIQTLLDVYVERQAQGACLVRYIDVGFKARTRASILEEYARLMGIDIRARLLLEDVFAEHSIGYGPESYLSVYLNRVSDSYMSRSSYFKSLYGLSEEDLPAALKDHGAVAI